MSGEERETTDRGSAGRRRVTVAGAMERLPDPGGVRFAKVLEHGTLEVEIYAPRGSDPQTPHTRDEVYVVVQGTGSSENLVKWSRGLSAQEARSFSLSRRARAGVGGRTSRARTSNASRA